MGDDDRSGRATTPAEGASIEPPEWFVEQANVHDPSVYEQFEAEWPDCWARAGDLLDWEQRYDDVFRGGDWPPFEWFPGGELNAAYNCVDRHLPERKNQLALIWEGQHGESRTYRYLELYREVNAVAAGLSDLGVSLATEEPDLETKRLVRQCHIPEPMSKMQSAEDVAVTDGGTTPADD